MKTFLTIFLLFGSCFLLSADNIDDLTAAIKNGNISRVKALVTAGTDVNQFDSDMYTPLSYAIEYNRLEIVEYLLINGADPDYDYTITMGPGQSIPHILLALQDGNKEMIDLLLRYGASKSTVDDYYNEELYSDIYRGDFVNAEELILSGRASLSDDIIQTLFAYEDGKLLQRLFIEKHGPEELLDGTYNLLDKLIQGQYVYNELYLPLPISTSFLRDDNNYFYYSPAMAFDNKLSTSWVEGVSGPGTGQKICFEVQPYAETIEIVPGYGDERYFYSNNRVKKARLVFYNILENVSQIPDDNWVCLKSLNYELELNFTDNLSYQSFNIDIPDAEDAYGGHSTGIVAVLKILEVYTGTKWDDTCIAEIRIK